MHNILICNEQLCTAVLNYAYKSMSVSVSDEVTHNDFLPKGPERQSSIETCLPKLSKAGFGLRDL